MKTTVWIGSALLLLGSVASLRAQPADIRQGLVAYWTLDTTDGVITPDAALYANDLSLVGMGESNFVPGQRGNAASFAGSGTYLQLSHDSEDYLVKGLPIYRAGSYTITMWVNGAAQTAKYLFSEANNTGNNNPLLLLQTGQAAANNNKFDVIIRNDAGGAGGTLVNHVVSSNVVFDNTWHYLAWVDDRGKVKLYVDGNPDPANFSYTPTGTFTFFTTAVGTLVRATVSTGAIFNGLIDEVGVWERILTQAEVQQVMTNGVEIPIPLLPPMFTSQPVNLIRNLGDNIQLVVGAAGYRPMSFQWYKNQEPIAEATGPTLALYHVTEADSGSYIVEVANEGGIVTSTNTLTVLPDPAPKLAQGLICYWPMEELAPDENGQLYTLDLYSHLNLLLVNADATSAIAGQQGNALAFNGFNQYGLREGGFPIYNNPAFSIALWVNANGLGQTDLRFFSEGSTNNNNPVFTLGTVGTDGTIRVYIRDEAGAVLLNKNTTRAPLDGTWHHVAWTETNGLAKLYIDGVLDETDLTYTHKALPLDQTAFGVVVRAAVQYYIIGAIDELALWNRVLSWTEIQEVLAGSIPIPEKDIAPQFTSEPAGQSVFTRAKVNFTFMATGTGPLAIQWRKDGVNLANETNLVLALPSAQFGDAGDYTVVVTNYAGSITSQVATLTVALRPPPPAELMVDFNNTGAEAGNTEPGFESFALPAVGPGPFKRVYGGAEVTVAGVGVNLEGRLRAVPANSGDFTEEKLLLDFIFARDTTAGQGMDVAVEYLEPNTPFRVTIWSFDNGSVTLDRISDWTANGELVKEAYTFFGSNLPASNDQYRFSFDTTSDDAGAILIQGRRNASAGGAINVFLNALAVARRELRVRSIEYIAPATVRLLIETLDPAAPLWIETKTQLSDPTWRELPGVTLGDPNGNLIEATFELSGAATGFYRVVAEP